MKLSSVIEGFWLEYRPRLAKSTIPSYEWSLRLFSDYIGADKEFEKITSDDVRRFLAYLQDEKELSGKSRSNIWVVLSSFWTWAEHEPGIKTPHVIRGIVRQPTHTRKEITPYTQAEVVAMLSACERSAAWSTRLGNTAHHQRDTATRDRAIIILFIDCGLRASELCNLIMSDYNKETGAIRVLGKGSKERTVIAELNTRKAIWRYLNTRRPEPRPTDPLFASRSNLPLDKDSLRHLIQRVAERVQVKGATLHRFRHTFAINFLRNGGNPLELQRMLGHENMDTVSIYVRLAQTDLQEAARRASPANAWRLK